jgi:hypothetical protein
MTQETVTTTVVQPTLSIDDKINGITPTNTETVTKVVQSEEVGEVHGQEKEDHSEQKQKISESASTESAESSEKPNSAIKIESDKSGESDASENNISETDDYGNEIPKARTYTEEDVNRMMRERFGRGQYANQPQATPQQVQQAAQDFKPDPASTESWEAQLDTYIDRRLETREKQRNQEVWQRQEQEKQMAFQAKFTTGMEKYKDFRESVQNLPITDSMMLATRDMKDPAAFLYAAAKRFPDEIKQIANIQDAYGQAAAIGRLEEKLRKTKNISKTAVPLQSVTGDITGKIQPKRSIDSLIVSHAKSKQRKV